VPPPLLPLLLLDPDPPEPDPQTPPRGTHALTSRPSADASVVQASLEEQPFPFGHAVAQ
jgi:hypothetical protein